jgi:hypothetical protein
LVIVFTMSYPARGRWGYGRQVTKLVPLVVLAALVALPATASAAVKTKVSLLRAADGVRLEVKVSSTKRFTKATRPRGVKVTAGGATYELKRVASSRKSTTWRSDPNAALETLGGTKVKVRISTRRRARTVRPTVPALSPAPGLPAPPGGTPAPQIDLTRDDAAGQSALATAGDLLLEWVQFSGSGLTAEYRRIWMLADGTFRLNIIDYTQGPGETCRQSVTGTWAFKEGYTTTYNGGGVVVKVTLTLSNGQTGDDIVAFANGDPNTVYVGAQLVQYERNPQIMQNCA